MTSNICFIDKTTVVVPTYNTIISTKIKLPILLLRQLKALQAAVARKYTATCPHYANGDNMRTS